MSSKYQDQKTTKRIRERDKFCQVCGSIKNLSVSHFFPRSHQKLRHYDDNLDLLCYEHHLGNKGFEYNREAYRTFKRKQLGEERYKKLLEIAKL